MANDKTIIKKAPLPQKKVARHKRLVKSMKENTQKSKSKNPLIK